MGRNRLVTPSKEKVSIILALLLLIFALVNIGHAGLFGSDVPEGKEIKDTYLEQLFTPEFPYESIKIAETKEGKRYVVIRARERVNDKKRVDYEDKTLRNRGIVVFESGSPRTNVLLISEMRLYRVVSQTPYVVEYCEVKGDSLEREPGVESVVRNEGKYLIIRINKNFGKVFERIEIYPGKETKCPEPPFVGKYPNSRSISCTERNKWIAFVYVTRDKAEDGYFFYRDRLKSHYRKVGFNFPEKSWEFKGEFGIQIKSSEVAKIRSYLNPADRNDSIKAPAPSNGVVFNIVITQIGLKPIIEEFSIINVFYCLDPQKIDRNIERMKRLYPEGVK